jgi:hypothetical protein
MTREWIAASEPISLSGPEEEKSRVLGLSFSGTMGGNATR